MFQSAVLDAKKRFTPVNKKPSQVNRIQKMHIPVITFRNVASKFGLCTLNIYQTHAYSTLLTIAVS